MEKVLWVTDQIPVQAAILLVDVQEQYFQEVEVSERVEQRIQDRLYEMRVKLVELKEQGHTIYAVVDREGIHPTLEGIADTYLPAWAYESVPNEGIDPSDGYLLNPDIIQTLSTAPVVLVCGLWRELCLYTVTLLLQKKGILSYLSVDPAISFENAMMWEDEDNISLESECEAYGVQIQTVPPK